MSTKSLPRSVLVTGAGGFVGRHVVECLREASSEMQIVALDRVRPGNSAVDHYVLCDLSREDHNQIAEVISRYGVGAIVHCAGSIRSDSASLVQDNLYATIRLIEAVLHARRGLPFCHLGSSAEYAPLVKPQKTSEEILTEPVSEYGRVKLRTTNAVLSASFRGDIRGYVLRLFNPIGTGMADTNLVGRVCKFLRNEHESHLSVGSLNSYRDYIDIRDVARAIVVSLGQVEHVWGQVINIGTGSAQSTRDLVSGLLAFSRRPVTLDEMISGSSRSESVYWQEADASKAQQLMHWKSEIAFLQTIEYIASNCIAPADGLEAQSEL